MKGLNDVLHAIDGYSAKRKAATERKLTRIGLKVKRGAMQRTPVDTSNLRNSADTAVEKNKVFVFYTANYAVHVHEDLEARHETGEAKFLQKAVDASRDFIVDELAQANTP